MQIGWQVNQIERRRRRREDEAINGSRMRSLSFFSSSLPDSFSFLISMRAFVYGCGAAACLACVFWFCGWLRGGGQSLSLLILPFDPPSSLQAEHYRPRRRMLLCVCVWMTDMNCPLLLSLCFLLLLLLLPTHMNHLGSKLSVGRVGFLLLSFSYHPLSLSRLSLSPSLYLTGFSSSSSCLHFNLL